MKAFELTANIPTAWAISLGRQAIAPIAIFAIVFLGYYFSTTSADYFSLNELFGRTPPDWYKHYVYLAEAFLQGTLDVKSVGIPDFYQDTVTVGQAKYLPFAPAPALLLMPFVALEGTGFSEVYFSMGLGALNVVLFWFLLGMLGVSNTTRLLMVAFFAFGTAHFYSATTGTVWFFGHVTAVFFLLLAIIALFRRAPPVLPAFLLGFAYLSREATVLSLPFFLYWIWRQRHDSITKESLLDRQSLWQMGQFCVALVPFVAFWFWYNIARFDGLFDTGYGTVHDSYTNGGIQYTYYLTQFPDAPRFNLFDVRSIPVHLHTMLLMPPSFNPDWSVFRPSPYGMSVLLTSPAFIYAFLVKKKDVLRPACWMAIAAISVPIFLHYSQGWVQFGYRFLLDFAPFLLILTALGFEEHSSLSGRRWQFALVLLSVVAGFWGRHWANQLGW